MLVRRNADKSTAHMKIELLYFEGCPTHDAARELIDETIAELAIDAEVEEIHVQDDEEAQALEFLGSPSIRVNGVDIDPDAKTEGPFGRSCRLYETADGKRGCPPAGMLVDALRASH